MLFHDQIDGRLPVAANLRQVGLEVKDEIASVVANHEVDCPCQKASTDTGSEEFQIGGSRGGEPEGHLVASVGHGGQRLSVEKGKGGAQGAPSYFGQSTPVIRIRPTAQGIAPEQAVEQSAGGSSFSQKGGRLGGIINLLIVKKFHCCVKQGASANPAGESVIFSRKGRRSGDKASERERKRERWREQWGERQGKWRWEREIGR